MKIANEVYLNREIDYAIQNNAVALDEMIIKCKWRDGRAVERAGFENQYTFTGIGGSNPPLSASRSEEMPSNP